jgi:hypothetical protein
MQYVKYRPQEFRSKKTSVASSPYQRLNSFCAEYSVGQVTPAVPV